MTAIRNQGRDGVVPAGIEDGLLAEGDHFADANARMTLGSWVLLGAWLVVGMSLFWWATDGSGGIIRGALSGVVVLVWFVLVDRVSSRWRRVRESRAVRSGPDTLDPTQPEEGTSHDRS